LNATPRASSACYLRDPKLTETCAHDCHRPNRWTLEISSAELALREGERRASEKKKLPRLLSSPRVVCNSGPVAPVVGPRSMYLSIGSRIFVVFI